MELLGSGNHSGNSESEAPETSDIKTEAFISTISPIKPNVNECEMEKTMTGSPSSPDRLSSSSAPGDRLYELAKERMKRAEQRMKSIPHGCTFKPEMESQKGKKAKDDTLEAANGGLDSSDELSRFHKLYQDAQERDHRLALTSLRISMEVPFKPKLSKKAATVHSKFEDRLRSAEERLADRQKNLIARTETEVFAECTFTPTIHSKKRSSSIDASRRRSTGSSTPTSLATTDAAPTAAKATQQGARPAPSSSSAAAERAVESFQQRLERTQQERIRKLEALKKEKEQQVKAQVTGAPQLATRAASRGTTRRSLSKADVEADASIDKVKDFHERLQSNEQARQKRIDELKAKAEAEMRTLFKPNVGTKVKKAGDGGEVDGSLVDPDADGDGLSLVERNMLFLEEKQRKLEMLRLRKDEEESKELSFRPNISKGSPRPKSAGRMRGSISGLNKGESSPTLQEAEESHVPVHVRLALEEQERQRRLAELRYKAEVESAADLTFQPHVHHDNNHNFGTYKGVF